MGDIFPETFKVKSFHFEIEESIQSEFLIFVSFLYFMFSNFLFLLIFKTPSVDKQKLVSNFSVIFEEKH